MLVRVDPLVHRYDRLRGRLLCRGRHRSRGHEGQRQGAPHSLSAHDR